MLSYPRLTVPRLVRGIQVSVMALIAGEGALDRVSDCTDLYAARYHSRWNARPASLGPSSPASVVWRPSAGGLNSSPRRWR